MTHSLGELQPRCPLDDLDAAAQRLVQSVQAWAESVRLGFPDRALTPKEMSLLTGFSESTLANWRWAGGPHTPPYCDINGSPRYMLLDALKWLHDHKKRSTSDE